MISNLSNFSKTLIISSAVIIFIILGSVNYQITGLSQFLPMLFVISVFYWSVFWPSLFGKWTIFALAIFQDALHGNPLGMSVFLALIYWGAIISQRKSLVREQFFALWLLFSVSLLLYIGVELVAYSIYYKKILFSYEIIMRFAVSVLIYPLIHSFFNALHMALRQVKG